MWKSIFRAVGLTSATLFMTGIAQAADDPVEILLNQVNLDLSNPGETATRITDKDFKSNDPLMRSRVYAMTDGTRVKLVGRDFSKSANIEKIRITYPIDETVYKSSYAALAESFGAPSAKRRGVLVWRLENTTRSSTQSKIVKVIAGRNKAEKRIITTDRQGGRKGNNPRLYEQPTRPFATETTRPTLPKTPQVRSSASDF